MKNQKWREDALRRTRNRKDGNGNGGGVGNNNTSSGNAPAGGGVDYLSSRSAISDNRKRKRMDGKEDNDDAGNSIVADARGEKGGDDGDTTLKKIKPLSRKRRFEAICNGLYQRSLTKR